jgi:hypothetical protein
MNNPAGIDFIPAGAIRGKKVLFGRKRAAGE